VTIAATAENSRQEMRETPDKEANSTVKPLHSGAPAV